MDTNFWGPHIWLTLHTIAAKYPQNPTNDNKYTMTNFLYSIAKLLPCPQCSNHFIYILNNGIISTITKLDTNVLKSNYTLSKWLYLFHDYINKAKGKKSPTFETVIGLMNSKIINNKDKIKILI